MNGSPRSPVVLSVLPMEHRPETALSIGILGPLTVSAGERVVSLGGPKQRAILAMLVLEAGRVVSRDRLADGLWGERVPATADKTIQVYVSRLRSAIGHSRLITVDTGYRLDIPAEAIDADRFAELAAQARAARRDGRTAAAAAILRRALGLWRGAPLADFSYSPFAQAEIVRLEEARLEALEERIDAELELGDAASVVGELEALVAANPLRERLRGLLMLALYRTQRQADALAIYQRLVKLLRDELGVVPGPELRRLHERIVVQDPALAVADAAPARPARAPGALIGRDRELEQLSRMIFDPQVRLVTVTGAGGVGKTALVLEAIRRVPPERLGEVTVVHLAAVTQPEQVLPELARVLRVRPAEGEELVAALTRVLREHPVGLVLDNFEHVIGAARQLDDLLEQGRPSFALVTSRLALGVPGEQVLRIDGLAFPAHDAVLDLDTVAGHSAVQLFVRRARLRDPEFTLSAENAGAVSGLAAALAGLPLAIELAAALAGVLSPQAILKRLGQLLDVEGGFPGVPGRQRSLRTTLDWSIGLLKAADRRLFSRLSAFTGGFTVEGAEAVASDEELDGGELLGSLARLADHELIRARPSQDGRRLGMLEPVRQHAASLLAQQPGEPGATQRRHAGYAARLSETAEAALLAPRQLAWFDRLDEERADLLAVARRCAASGDAETVVAILAPLDIYWTRRGRSPEVLGLLRSALDSSVVSVPLRARGLLTLGWLLYDGGERGPAIESLTESLKLYEREQNAEMEMWLRAHLALNHSVMGQPEAAAANRERALQMASAFPDGVRRALVLFCCGISFTLTDRASALSVLNESAAILQAVDDELYLGSVTNVLGERAYLVGELALARESLSIATRAAEQFPGGNLQALALGNLGVLDLLEGRDETARDNLARALRIAVRCGNWITVRECVNALSALELRCGRRRAAERLAAAAQMLTDAPPSRVDDLVTERFLMGLSPSVRAGSLTSDGRPMSSAEVQRVITQLISGDDPHHPRSIATAT